MAKIMITRLPKYIVDWIDILVEKEVYKSRSEAIRDFLRSYVLERNERR